MSGMPTPRVFWDEQNRPQTMSGREKRKSGKKKVRKLTAVKRMWAAVAVAMTVAMREKG